jgi:hypothetical protein
MLRAGGWATRSEYHAMVEGSNIDEETKKNLLAIYDAKPEEDEE